MGISYTCNCISATFKVNSQTRAKTCPPRTLIQMGHKSQAKGIEQHSTQTENLLEMTSHLVGFETLILIYFVVVE